MSKKCQVIQVFLMNIPNAVVLSLTAMLLSVGKIVPPLFLLNFCMAYIISDIVGLTLPVEKWGMGFANFFKVKPDTLAFGLTVNVAANAVYVVINCLILTFVNVIVIAKAPVMAYFMGMATTIVPIYLVSYVASLLARGWAIKTAKKICGE